MTPGAVQLPRQYFPKLQGVFQKELGQNLAELKHLLMRIGEFFIHNLAERAVFPCSAEYAVMEILSLRWSLAGETG